MKSFNIKKILIPVDFSETSLLAFEHGSFMAKLFKADLMLVHVITKKYLEQNVLLPKTKIENIDKIIKIAESKIDEISKTILKKYGVQSTVSVVIGKVSSEIVSLAKKNKADVIVMGTHGASGFEEYFIGSNAARVVIESHCPVISIQANAKKIGFKKILLPVDNSITSRQKVEQAMVLAEHYGSKIYVLGLLTDDESEHRKTFELKIQQMKEYFEKHDISCNTKIAKSSNHGKRTIMYADEIGADLTVVMTEQEIDASEIFIGPTAQKIVNHSKIPVMSIRPTGVAAGGFHNNPV